MATLLKDWSECTRRTPASTRPSGVTSNLRVPRASRGTLCHDVEMTTVDTHQDGMPCWVDIMVDTEEQHHDLRAFLSTLFDWTWDGGGPEMGHYALAHHNGQPVLGLGRNAGSTGETTTYFSTSSIEATAAKATELGASFAMPIMPVMELGSMAVLKDPTDALFGLWQPGTFHGFGVQYEANAPGWFDHVSERADEAGAFYASLSGHQLTPLEPPMRVLQNGDQWYASLSPLPDHETPAWKPIFVVDSLERIHETVPRHGGAILVESMPVPGSALCLFTEPVNGTTMIVMQGGEQPA